MRSDHDRLRDILDCAERITRYGDIGGPEDLVLDAILHNLVVIGEAVRGLSDACREREPAVRWSAIVSMRNLLAHEYFRIEYEQVRDVVEVHVPTLAAAVRRLLSSFAGPNRDLGVEVGDE
ncbi:MAG: HepT-like ribonuclease domain-containing protein [Pseudonocardiaceae bacterium]